MPIAVPDQKVEDQRPKVLIVDDDASIRVALERGLRRYCSSILQVSDGEEGLRHLKEGSASVVFLDLRMPGMDGHTFLRRLSSQIEPTAVVVVSGQGGMEDVVGVLRSGAVDYLRKPWTQSDLMAALGRAMETVEQKRRLAALPAAKSPAPWQHTPVPVSVAVTASGSGPPSVLEAPDRRKL